MSAPGFYTTLTKDLEASLRASRSVIFSIETTAPTRYSPAERISSQTIIGGIPWETYRALHPGVLPRTEPRLRVLSLRIPDLGTLSYDWPLLSGSDKARLLNALFDRDLLVGHNVGPQLCWLFAEQAAQSPRIADTMLLVQHLRPTALLSPFRRAASKDPAKRMEAERVLRKHHGRCATTLEYIANCFGIKPAPSELEAHHCWSLSELSQAHQHHCEEKLKCIDEIFTKLFADGVRSTSMEQIDRAAPLYRNYIASTVRLSAAHLRGVPFDEAASSALKQAGSDLSQARTTLQNLERAARGDGRLHSLIAFGTVTGRATSHDPCLQNVRRAPEWRRLVRARHGHCILSIDYSSIELRIAAAIAARAAQDLRSRLVKVDRSDWFMKRVSAGALAQDELTWPKNAEMEPAERNRALTLASAQRVLGQATYTMQAAFQRGIDLHLVTAVGFARCLGLVEFEGTALAWLAGQSSDARLNLKEALTGQRQTAKACNFGLLYGLSASGLHSYGTQQFGLSWSPAEAEDMRNTWLELYPEITLWHLWTRQCQSKTVCSGTFKKWNRYTGDLITPVYSGRLYTPSTLSGRQLAILDDPRQAYNYQAQGSCADMMATAIRRLPEEVANLLLFPVHDELVFEVPSSKIGTVEHLVREAFLMAGAEVLDPDIPVEVEVSVGDTWN